MRKQASGWEIDCVADGGQLQPEIPIGRVGEPLVESADARAASRTEDHRSDEEEVLHQQSPQQQIAGQGLGPRQRATPTA